MHWRQREMLFEQREALKEQTGAMRKKKSGKKGNEIAKKDPRGTDMSGDTPRPPAGRSPKGRRFEGMHSKKEGMHSKKEGTHLKKKAESHCEAYAEAYVRGVEQALSEKRKVTKDRRLRTNRGVVPTTKVREGLLPEGEPGPRPFKRRDLRLQRQGQSVKPTTRAKAPKR